MQNQQPTILSEESIARRVVGYADDSAAAVISARATITDKLITGRNAEELGRAVNSLAAAEGTARVWSYLSQWLAREQQDPDFDINLWARRALEQILSDVIIGADDSWSGRGNDVKRCAHEGKLEAAKRAMYLLQAF